MMISNEVTYTVHQKAQSRMYGNDERHTRYIEALFSKIIVKVALGILCTPRFVQPRDKLAITVKSCIYTSLYIG